MPIEPIILKSASAADFLASLPALAGFTSRRSLVLVPFRGARTIGVARMDLPPAEEPDAPAAFASAAVGILSRVPGCDGAVLVVYADDAFPAAIAAHAPLVAAVEAHLHDAGFAVRDLLCVASDGWASWGEPNIPLEGHPLSEIASSPLRARAEASLDGAEVREYDADAALPDPDPEFAALLGAAVVDLQELGGETDAFGLLRPAAPIDPAEVVEQLLRTEPAATPLPLLARLIALASLPATRDEMIIQIAFGEKEGRKVAAENARLHAKQARTGRSMDDLVREEESRSRRPFRMSGDLLLGATRRPPSRERIGVAIAILRRAIAHVDELDRPGALCVLAWLNWAIGRSSVASAHIRQARRIDPDLGMAQLMETLFAGGRLPEWVFVER